MKRTLECFFEGTLSSTKYCGGIVGGYGNAQTIVDCFTHYLPFNKTSYYGPINGRTPLYAQSSSNCYYDSDLFGSISGKTSEVGKSSEAFASGEVASLLNHGVETGEETFHQRIGTDPAPVFTVSNESYVFKTADGTYTNQCTHPHMEAIPAQRATCVNSGHYAYWHCPHPLCNCYYGEAEGIITEKFKNTDYFFIPRTM